MMERKRVLILGLNGLIGWHLFHHAPKDVEGFGTFRKELPVFDRPGCFRIDMRREEEVFSLLEEVRPHILVHAWAMCDLDLCEAMPAMAREINVKGTETVLKAAGRWGRLEHFVYMSTDHVFDGCRGKYHEDDPPCPRHIYGRTKLEAEAQVQAAGLPFLIIRPGLVIGPSAQGTIGPRDFLLHRVRSGKPTHYFTDEWRSPIRGRDFVSQVYQLIFSGARGIFHVSGSRIYSRYDLARRITAENEMDAGLVFPRLRQEDEWAAIRPQHLTLVSHRYCGLRGAVA